MNNWQYANEIPTAPWRGAMTIARSVSLRKTDRGYHIVQSPAEGLNDMRRRHRKIESRMVPIGETRIGDHDVEGLALEILVEFEHGDVDDFGLKVRCGDGEETVIGVERRAGTVYVDRARSGDVGFSRHFAGRHSARPETGGRVTGRVIRLHVIVDTTSVEVFADGGRVVLTDQIFPSRSSRGVSLFAKGGAARLHVLDTWELRP
jgi:fructan beta-fructosidase